MGRLKKKHWQGKGTVVIQQLERRTAVCDHTFTGAQHHAIENAREIADGLHSVHGHFCFEFILITFFLTHSHLLPLFCPWDVPANGTLLYCYPQPEQRTVFPEKEGQTNLTSTLPIKVPASGVAFICSTHFTLDWFPFFSWKL